MNRLSTIPAAVALGLALAAAPAPASPVAAETPGAAPPESGVPQLDDEAARLAREAAEKLLQAFGLLIDSLPQYEAPELLPNGDIIIRRKPKPAPGSPGKTRPAPAPDRRT
jgi:hypothetical protein